MPVPKRLSDEDDYSPTATLRRAFGQEVADKFEDHYAGRVVYIPTVATPEHEMAILLGYEQARLLCEEAGGLQYAVPVVNARERRIKKLHDQGMLQQEIARELCMGVRGVQFVLNRVRGQERARAEKAYARASGGAVDV